MRCWLKKSYLVSKKVGPWLGGFAAAIIVAYVIWLGATSQKAAEIWTVFTGWCGSASTVLSNLIGSVPWPVWAALAVIGAIVGYSGAWCLARRFTYEDWQSDEAKNALAVLVTVALAVLVTVALVTVALALAALALALVTALAVLVTVALALADSDPSSSAYFVSRFLGAYLHYRKRTKNFENKPCNKKD
jgi:uncharacterized Tic20 family protein